MATRDIPHLPTRTPCQEMGCVHSAIGPTDGLWRCINHQIKVRGQARPTRHPRQYGCTCC
jgi:hypothetical protein